MTMVRGSNPVWSYVDLKGKQFDDTYYMFVLENTIPYAPATVWHDPNGNVEWTDPIRFFANGTLPIDIYWDPSVVYRLEFRRGNTQQDPLIYLVENYVPSGGGISPAGSGFVTDNQITNPQFESLYISNPFALTNVSNLTINIGPGWFLDLTGTGNITLTRLALNSSSANPTNAPYALNIKLSGTWMTAVLRQRFDQNGMLWASQEDEPSYVSCSLTALYNNFPQTISAVLKDSLGNLLTEVLPMTSLSGSYEEYTGFGQMSLTKNTDIPPAAYIDFLLTLPTNADLNLTSFQLIQGQEPLEYEYEQTTIQRQIDNTYHVYRDSIVLMPKNSILTGWNFGFNPWQFQTTSPSTIITFGYTADQTIVVQQNYVSNTIGSNISVQRAGAVHNYGFAVTAVTGANQFALIQYIDPTTVRQYWGSLMSSLCKILSGRQNPSLPCRVKMRLIYRTSLPPTLSQTEPISSWTAGSDPVFAAGWTALMPNNDSAFNLANGDNVISFNTFQLPQSSSDNMILGIVIYTIDNLLNTGTPDTLVFNDISLVPNEFAIESNPLSFDETLSRCQFYYQKSFVMGVLPADGLFDTRGISMTTQTSTTAGSLGPVVRFPVYMRSIPTVTLYNPTNTANGQIYNNGIGSSWSASVAALVSNWGFVTTGNPPGGVVGNGAQVHWSAGAVLGT